MNNLPLRCPHCSEEFGDNNYATHLEDVIGGKVELWLCKRCNGLFKVYYGIERITPLNEDKSRERIKSILSEEGKKWFGEG